MVLWYIFVGGDLLYYLMANLLEVVDQQSAATRFKTKECFQ